MKRKKRDRKRRNTTNDMKHDMKNDMTVVAVSISFHTLEIPTGNYLKS